MTYYADFGLFATRPRNEEVLREVKVAPREAVAEEVPTAVWPRFRHLRAADATAALSETCGEACFTYGLRAGREGVLNRQIR